MLQNAVDWWASLSISNAVYFDKTLYSLVIFLVLWLINKFINILVFSRTSDINLIYTWRVVTRNILLLIGTVLIGRQWLESIGVLFTLLGLVAAALTITQKEVFLNLSGGAIIISRNLFSIGDRVQIGNQHGDIIGIGAFYFTLIEIGEWIEGDQSTGRIVKVPNSIVWSTSVANYTKSFPFIWNELSILITPQSDYETFRKELHHIGVTHTQEVVGEAQSALRKAKDDIIMFNKLTPIVYVKPQFAKPSGYLFTLRYLCQPKNRRLSEQIMMDQIFLTIKNNPDIQLRFDL